MTPTACATPTWWAELGPARSPPPSKDLDASYADNDVVLYDRPSAPGELVNLAAHPAQRALVED